MTKEQALEMYYGNSAKKLHKMVDKVLKKIGAHNGEITDWYDLSYEITFHAIESYDESKDFNTFLYSCLLNKFKTELTRQNRIKRQSDKNSIPIDTPIGEGSLTLIDVIPEKETINGNEGYSEKMEEYLSRLSTVQRMVLELISIGYIKTEIMNKLHITSKQYENCYNAIHSYKNISILM